MNSKFKIKKIILLSLVFSYFILGNANTTKAESILWTLPKPVFVFSNTTSFGDAGSASNFTKGKVFGALKNVTATVKYNTRVVKAETGEVIACGSSVPAGTRLKFEFVPHVPEDVTWFGTGGTYDSPYGSWNIGGVAPANICVAKNYIHEENTDFGGLIKAYADLSVQPPNKSITGLPSGGPLSNCINVGSNKECDMNIVGTYDVSFKFSNTYGIFHYGISSTGGVGYRNYGALQAGSCWEHEAPFLVTDSANKDLIGAWRLLNWTLQLDLPIEWKGYRWNGGISIFELQKPAHKNLVEEWGKVKSHIAIAPQEISCPITVIPGPEIPGLYLLSPKVSRNACLNNTEGNEIPYTFKSINSGKSIKFLIDWNNDGSTDQILPPNGYTTSPTVNTTRVWPDSGSKTFNVMIQDNEGASSSKVVFTSKSDCVVLDPLDPEIEIETSTVALPPGKLFEGGIRQILTNRKCSLDLSSVNDSTTCILTKNNQQPVNVDVSGSLELEPGNYAISCKQSSGQILVSDIVCLLAPDFREI